MIWILLRKGDDMTTDQDWEETKKDLLKHRRENFAIEVTTRKDVPNGSLFFSYPEEDEIVLSASSNGRQFQSISLLPEEVDKVIEALVPHASPNCLRRIARTVNRIENV